MNIALLVETTIPPVSRANLRLYKLAVALIGKNHQIKMVVPSVLPWKKRNVSFEGINVCQYFGFCKFLYSKARLPIRIYHLVASVFTVTRLHSKNSFDVIHAWNPLAGFAAVLAGKILKKPVFVDFTDFYSDIAVTDSVSLVSKALEKIEKFVLKNADKVVVVSSVMKKRLTNKGIAENKIEIVEDGTDGDMFCNKIEEAAVLRRRLGAENKPLIIYHGDIKEPDGVDVLFYAFSEVLKKKSEAKLLIVGGGGNYFETKLKKLARDLDIEKSIIYSGWIPHQEVPLYISASDIGAMPMRATLNHNCYLSFKLFEYWGCGKPVVTTRLEAISKIVKNKENGMVVESENIRELAEAILYLISHKKESEAMGKEGRKMIDERFDWKKIMKKEVKLYEGIRV